ncbi:hypothetical protein [Streptomyces sp. NPDC058297]|uniref:hypothetical protein n=1 Tax=Streptomyces sp. NPDC058297 TaxID=3346433 RepID=UPI0036E09F08
MRIPYATANQLAAWTRNPAPSDADRLLARASEDIDDALLTAVYCVDDAGMPTDPDVVQALADAPTYMTQFFPEVNSGDAPGRRTARCG